MPCDLWTVAQSLADDRGIADFELAIAIEYIDRNLQVAQRSGRRTSPDIDRLKRVLELAIQHRRHEL